MSRDIQDTHGAPPTAVIWLAGRCPDVESQAASITAVTVEKRPVSEVAGSYGVARSWVYALLARYQAEGEAAYEPRFERGAGIRASGRPARGSPARSGNR